MTPTNGHVYIKPELKSDKISDGGIILVSNKHAFKNGVIIAIANDVEDVSVGDRVMYISHRERPIEGTDNVMVSAESIWAKV